MPPAPRPRPAPCAVLLREVPTDTDGVRRPAPHPKFAPCAVLLGEVPQDIPFQAAFANTAAPRIPTTIRELWFGFLKTAKNTTPTPIAEICVTPVRFRWKKPKPCTTLLAATVINPLNIKPQARHGVPVVF